MQTKCNERHFYQCWPLREHKVEQRKTWHTVLILEQKVPWNLDISVKSLCLALLLRSELGKKYCDSHIILRWRQVVKGISGFFSSSFCTLCWSTVTILQLVADAKAITSFWLFILYFLPGKHNLRSTKNSKAAIHRHSQLTGHVMKGYELQIIKSPLL